MIGYYNYTVILTYVSLASSVTGIFLACGGNVLGAIWMLLVSGLCDMFDGKIARTKKNRTENEKKFGIQIDSLCDVVCFGVLPAVIGWQIVQEKVWLLPVCGIFVLCAVIRLAYFNVTEEERQSTTGEARVYYEGLPVTSAALILPFVYCLRQITGKIFEPVFIASMFAVAVLFISPIKIPKAGKITSVVLILLGLTEFICLLVTTF